MKDIFRKLFPPRELIVLYEDYDPDEFIKKMNSRKDKYIIKQKLNVSDGLDKIKKDIIQSQGVVIYDVHSELRNVILKMCYENDIRAYSTTNDIRYINKRSGKSSFIRYTTVTI